MKRLYIASLVLLALALVGLSSCGDASLRREIIGYWVGDSATLRAAVMDDVEEPTFHAYDFSVEDERHLTLIVDYTTNCIIDGEHATTRRVYYLVCTYKIHRGTLYISPDEAKSRVELKKYLIGGLDDVDHLRQTLKGASEEEIQRQAQKARERVVKNLTEDFTGGLSEIKDRIIATKLKVKDGVLTMQDEDLGKLCTYHRR